MYKEREWGKNEKRTKKKEKRKRERREGTIIVIIKYLKKVIFRYLATQIF